MQKQIWFGLLAVLGVATSAVSADASVARDSTGKFVWSRTTVSTENGTVLQVYGDDPNINYVWSYVDATGRYGGGDTADGRMTAKRRANGKVVGCTSAFHTYGLFTTNKGGSIWSQNCGIAPEDKDIRVMADATAYFAMADMTRRAWCEVARGIASQRGVTGPVYLSGDIKVKADASGTEADEVRFLGSYARIACF